MDIKEMFINGWTVKRKFDCTQCGAKKSIKHPDYICKDCGQIYKLKMKMNT